MEGRPTTEIVSSPLADMAGYITGMGIQALDG